MSGIIHWDESEIQEVVRSRTCNQGIEYFIYWKNGERPTWELRDAFTTKKLFDEFDRKAAKNAMSWAPIFNAEQKFIKNNYARRKKTRSSKAVQVQNAFPSAIQGVIEVNKTWYGIVTYYGSQSQLIKWDILKNEHAELANKFMESRCLKDILN